MGDVYDDGVSDPERYEFQEKQPLRVDLWHLSTDCVTALDPYRMETLGTHFGTLEQCTDIGLGGKSYTLLRGRICMNRPRRCKDMPDSNTNGRWYWKRRLQRARSDGYDGVVYLNTYEGVDFKSLSQAKVITRCLTVRQWREVGKAGDSVLVFDPSTVRILDVIRIDRARPGKLPSARDECGRILNICDFVQKCKEVDGAKAASVPQAS